MFSTTWHGASAILAGRWYRTRKEPDPRPVVMAVSSREFQASASSPAPRSAAKRAPSGGVAPVTYRVSMPEPAGHEFHVEMEVPALPGHATADIVFPAWAPGSYLVRDFVRHVYGLTVTDRRGRRLGAERLDKQRWRIASGGAPFRVRYRVFAFEVSVRTSFLDASHAYWNGSSLFFFVDGEIGRPCQVGVTLPRGARGATFEVALYGRTNADPRRLEATLRQVAIATADLFDGRFPFDRYLFI